MEHYRLERVADGVLAAISRPDGGGVGNAAIVDLGGRTLVFDTGITPQAGEELRHVAEQIAPVAFVVNSHWHGDHIRGNQAFAGAEIVATERTRELIETRGAERLAEHKAVDVEAYLASLPEGDELESTRHFAATIATVELRPPTRTFEGRLDLGGAEVVELGSGHTESDSVVVVADRCVVLMADLLTTRMHPWMGDGNPKEWIRILGEVETMGGTTFVPGHGEVATLEDVRDFRRHLSDFLADPEAIRDRYPGWDFQDGMDDRNRAFLSERTAA